jgi:hypothetical protein
MPSDTGTTSWASTACLILQRRRSRRQFAVDCHHTEYRPWACFDCSFFVSERPCTNCVAFSIECKIPSPKRKKNNQNKPKDDTRYVSSESEFLSFFSLDAETEPDAESAASVLVGRKWAPIVSPSLSSARSPLRKEKRTIKTRTRTILGMMTT